ncbi:hypothetical protein F2Q69_00050775 [Brassica cretica]|uniref:Uncharacterized protein n=1 Tax=Brassica cretica TaxID=69181 RepID=A0A8S9Q438_BRACR|nr:hypothetical protein F2Q69_00050775 [Brassica cretica]
MESPKKIAHEIGGVKRDALRFGLNGVKSDIVGSHPLESESVCFSEYYLNFPGKEIARVDEEDYHWAYLRYCTSTQDGYGQANPLTRPSGPIPSSMLGLEVYTGAIDDFGFEDYLNDPRDSETFKPVDLHHGMEVRLGMSKGPVSPSFM